MRRLLSEIQKNPFFQAQTHKFCWMECSKLRLVLCYLEGRTSFIERNTGNFLVRRKAQILLKWSNRNYDCFYAIWKVVRPLLNKIQENPFCQT